MLQYHTIPVTAFQQNCSLVWCDQTMEAAVIDPGGDLEQIGWEIERLGLALKAIWLTHAHIDHAGGTRELADAQQLPIIGPHPIDRKSTRLNSSHQIISYAVFCLKKKKIHIYNR